MNGWRDGEMAGWAGRRAGGRVSGRTDGRTEISAIDVLYDFFFLNVNKCEFNDEALEMLLHLDFLQIFFGLTIKPNYIELD